MAVEVTEEDVKKILEKLPNTIEGRKTFKTSPLSENPVGFWGDHIILKIYNDNLEICEFFLKAIPLHIEKRMEFIHETGFFIKEMKFYQHFTPVLNNLSSQSWAPICYLVKDEHYIVLENLKDHKTFESQQQTFDSEHFRVAIKTLAIFHASSLIYEQKFGSLSSNEMDMLEEVSYPKREGSIRCIQLESAVKVLSKIIQLIPKYQNSSKLNEILEKFPLIMRSIYDFVETSDKYKNVISHGDLWLNNIMFKYDANEKVETCKFIDFQFARYAPPAVDLATLIYTSTTSLFRETHLNDVLNIYCDALESELMRNNIKLDVLPRDEIVKSLSEYRMSGLIESLLFNHLTMLPSNLASEMMNSSDEYEKFITKCRADKCLKAFQQDYYRERITEILCELIDNFIFY